MFRLPVVAITLGICLLRADTIEQIHIDFHEFDQPTASPANVANYYSGGSGVLGTDGLPGPDYGLYGRTDVVSPWVAGPLVGTGLSSFLLRSPGAIYSSRGIFNLLSFSITGGFPGSDPGTFPIRVLDSSGSTLGEADLSYIGSSFQQVTIPFQGEGSIIAFGQVGGIDASAFQFTDLVTYVPMADAPASAPEPPYAAIMGAVLLLAGIVTRGRARAAVPDHQQL
jgi:hypothetical protein